MQIQSVGNVLSDQGKSYQWEHHNDNPQTTIQLEQSLTSHELDKEIASLSGRLIDQIGHSEPLPGKPKIMVVDLQFVIHDHSNGLVYHYNVVSIGGSWHISLGGIVG